MKNKIKFIKLGKDVGRYRWIIAGRIHLPTTTKSISFHALTASLSIKMEKFWQIENFPQSKHLLEEKNDTRHNLEKTLPTYMNHTRVHSIDFMLPKDLSRTIEL